MTDKKQRLDESGKEYDLNGKSPEYWEGVIEGRQHTTSSPQTQMNQDKLERHFEGLEGRFDSHLEVYRQNGKEMAGLKVEIKNLCGDIARLEKTIVSSFKENTKRIGSLENWRWYVLGFIFAIAVVGGFVLKLWNDNINYKIQNVVQIEFKDRNPD